MLALLAMIQVDPKKDHDLYLKILDYLGLHNIFIAFI
jgi:hypothetical protein